MLWAGQRPTFAGKAVQACGGPGGDGRGQPIVTHSEISQPANKEATLGLGSKDLVTSNKKHVRLLEADFFNSVLTPNPSIFRCDVFFVPKPNDIFPRCPSKIPSNV